MTIEDVKKLSKYTQPRRVGRLQSLEWTRWTGLLDWTHQTEVTTITAPCACVLLHSRVTIITITRISSRSHVHRAIIFTMFRRKVNLSKFAVHTHTISKMVKIIYNIHYTHQQNSNHAKGKFNCRL